MIATARHLTFKVKRGVGVIASTPLLPAALTTRLHDATNYSQQLYQHFAQVGYIVEPGQISP